MFIISGGIKPLSKCHFKNGKGKYERMIACYHLAVLICRLDLNRDSAAVYFGLLVVGGMKTMCTLCFALKFYYILGRKARL